MKDRVFVTDGHWRKTLAAVRGLGREGVRVTVGESTRIATARFSRHCRRAVVYPSPMSRPLDFLAFLFRDLERHPCELLLPMEDLTVRLLSRHRADLPPSTRLALPDHENLVLAMQKDRVLDLADGLGIPVPATWRVRTLQELDELRDRIPYPAVIKPTEGSGAVGVRYVSRPEDLKGTYQRVHARFPFPLIQERIPREGPGYGVSLLFDRAGGVRASFVHRRLREYPVSGGASTLRESVRRDDLLEMAVSLMRAIGWFGVAQVEFKTDPRDGTPRLMEVNPRFWGSLALALQCGVNFPHLLLRVARGEKVAEVRDYPVGRKCRWLLPGDLLHFLQNPRRMRLDPSFFRFRDGDTGYDICSLRDPLPVLGRVLTGLILLTDPDMKARLRERKP